MPLAREWFDLQLRCAERAAVITGLQLDDALLRYTALYHRMGLGYTFEPNAATWQEFLRGLHAAGDRAVFTAEFCAANSPPAAVGPFGCFSYTSVPAERRIRLHFVNADQSGAGPLSQERVAVRHAELRALFAEVAVCHPQARTVRGNSWLHGIAAYQRLFPPEYGASAIRAPMTEEFQYMALWGQFLDNAGALKPALARSFLDGMARARMVEELAAAVPKPVYEVECAVSYFYTFYRSPLPAGGSRCNDRRAVNHPRQMRQKLPGYKSYRLARRSKYAQPSRSCRPPARWSRRALPSGC